MAKEAVIEIQSYEVMRDGVFKGEKMKGQVRQIFVYWMKGRKSEGVQCGKKSSSRYGRHLTGNQALTDASG
jgi:hypothetical protein